MPIQIYDLKFNEFIDDVEDVQRPRLEW